MAGFIGKDHGRKKKSNLTKSIPPGCVFCNSSEDCEELVGKSIQSCGMTVHYFCMLLSSGLCQKGRTDKDGILGFLPKDIQAEVNRGKKLTCYFCKKKGATIGCTTKSCRISFHLRCGRVSGTLHQFFGNFGSYCPTHRPRQAALTSDRLAFFGTANTMCAICICTVEARASNETLRSPCCRSSWFHRDCIQQLATTAGLHFFKCPLCNNKEMFQEEMLEFGIYIPDQDAAWELVPNAYQELLERYSRCDVQKCLCPKGRDYNKDKTKWEILLCVCCGSQGCHVTCQGLSSNNDDWMCPDCEEISKKVSKAKKTRGRPRKKGKNSSASLKEELKRDYQKLQTKACGSRLDTKPLQKKESTAGCSAGTSGPSGASSSNRRSLLSPRVKNFPNTVVRITSGGDGENSDVNVTSSDEDIPQVHSVQKAKRKAKVCLGHTDNSSVPSSDEDIPLEPRARKSKTKAKMCLGGLGNSSRIQGSSVPNISPDQPFPIGQLRVRVRPCNVLPGTSVSIHNLDDSYLNPHGKRKCLRSKSKAERPSKKHCETVSMSDSDVKRSDESCERPSTSAATATQVSDKLDLYVLSPNVIRKIKAPKALPRKPVEIVDDSEPSCDEEVSFREQPVFEDQLADENENSSSSVEDSDNSVQSPRHARLCKNLGYKDSKCNKKRESRERLRLADVVHVVSLSDDEPELAIPQQVPVVSSTVSADQDQVSVCCSQPNTDSPAETRRSPSQIYEPKYIELDMSMSESPQVTRRSPEPVNRKLSIEEDVLTISSASDEDPEEVIFLKTERFYSTHQFNGHRRQWMTAQTCSSFKTTPPENSNLQYSTVCTNTNAGQILLRTCSDQVALPIHIGSMALHTSSKNPQSAGVCNTTSSSATYASSARQSPVVIDLTDNPPSNKDKSPEPIMNHRLPAQPKASCTYTLRANSLNISNSKMLKSEKTISPLKIHQGKLESIRSAVTSTKAQSNDEATPSGQDAAVIDITDADSLAVYM
ncbi:uncharacterized protein LOC135467035 [Liolophura sinensis]|uniref:uncharacterized protein LOC135467035 n=1 Tax=Liolophura sinensis TaxID=3198878 RepID=UPI003158381B